MDRSGSVGFFYGNQNVVNVPTNLCNNNRHICGVIIERVGACIQSFNANCNIQWFRCMLDRLWAANGVVEMLSYHVEWPIEFLLLERVGELLD